MDLQHKLMKKQAILITPHHHKIGGLTVTTRRWDDDGNGIWFMLENHTFVHAHSDTQELDCEQVEVVPYGNEDLLRAWNERDRVRMSLRPFRRPCDPYESKQMRTQQH